MFRYSSTLPPELRQMDPADIERWEAVANEVTARLDGKAVNEFAEKAIKSPSVAAKIIYLRQMADGLSKAAAPSMPCKSGCSDCCYMPVVIGEVEAAQIAKVTGARMRKKGFAYSAAGKAEYDGKACTFLVGGKCSIYDNRPFACRVYFVIERDNSRCKVTQGKPAMAPSIDVSAYHQAYARAFGLDVLSTMSDVRDYFPDGLSRRR